MTRGERTSAFLSAHRRWTLALLGATLALTAAVVFATWPTGSAPTDSGVQGRVWLGPLSPVQKVGGSANERPYSATIQVLGPGSRVVATVRSGQDGHFRVNLAAGTYVLQGVSGGNGLPRGIPVSVVVMAHRFTATQARFDTGIR
jgi:hypothetical protein